MISLGTVDAGTSALNADAILNAMSAAIDAHASWTFVEEVVGTVGGCRTRMHYNAVEDIYIGLTKKDTASIGFGLFLCEGFSTPNATKFVPMTSGGIPSTANSGDDSFTGLKHVANQTQQVDSAGNGFIYAPSIGNSAATPTKYRILVTPTGIVCGIGTGWPRFAGALDVPAGSLWRSPWVYGNVGTGTGVLALNRCSYNKGNGSMEGMSVEPFTKWMGTLSKEDNLNAYVYSSIIVLSNNNLNYFGKLKDIISFKSSGISAVVEDTVILNGVGYTLFYGDVWVRNDV